MAITTLTPKAKPTNYDLQAAQLEMHDCLHKVGADVTLANQHIALLATAMGVRLPTKEEIAGGQFTLKVARRLGGLHPWQGLAVAVPAIVGSLGLYKVIEPAIIAFGAALHHALMTWH